MSSASGAAVPLTPATVEKNKRGEQFEIALRSLEAFAVRGMGAGAAFGFNLVLAHRLGADQAGLYYLGVAIAMIGSTVGRVGLDNSVMRCVAVRTNNRDWAGIRGVHRNGTRIAGGLSAVIAVAVVLAAPLLAGLLFHRPDMVGTLRLMGLSVVPFSLLTINAVALKGILRSNLANLIEGGGVTMLTLLLLIAFYATSTALGAAAIYLGSCVGVYLLSEWLWWKSVPRVAPSLDHAIRTQLLQSSMPLFWVALMNMLMGYTDTLLIGVWLNSTEVALYNVAARTTMLAPFILVAINSVVAPRFAARFQAGQMKELGRLVRYASSLVTALALPLLMLVVVWPEFVLQIFGREFLAANHVIAILALGQFVNVSTGSVGYLLMMTGHEKLVRNNVIFAAMVNVVLNVLLIPRFGITGAAVAMATSVICKNGIAAYLAYRHLGILTVPLPMPLVRRIQGFLS